MATASEPSDRCIGYPRERSDGSATVPTVAAVHGACAGGGLDLVLSCDLLVAGRNADGIEMLYTIEHCFNLIHLDFVFF